MAYVDLVSTGVTPIAGGATYNFAFDTPIAADGSPHITHLGFQADLVTAGAWAAQSTLGRLITNYRVKVGSTTIINFDDPFSDPDGTTPGNLSVLAQKVGGVDALQAISNSNLLGELSLPFGIPANVSHRVNVSITLADESSWAGVALTPGSTEFNMVTYFGTAKEQVCYGSRQDFDLTNAATRTITIYGKQGYAMLGVSIINDSDEDSASSIRVNNGAFRDLKAAQWRVLDGTYGMGIRSDAAADSPSWVLKRAGYQFIDLKRITAGSNVDLAVTAAQTTTASFFPVYVAPINAKSGPAPKQTAPGAPVNVTATVNNESAY